MSDVSVCFTMIFPRTRERKDLKTRKGNKYCCYLATSATPINAAQ